MNVSAMIDYLTENDIRYFNWNRHSNNPEMIIDLYDDRGRDWILRLSIDADWNIHCIARMEKSFEEALEEATINTLIRHKEDGVVVFEGRQLAVDELKDFILARAEKEEEAA